ncbi:hypothetical protein SHI21_05345 [Bacteriovorax sp. PP10]|uniref:Lipoprotein n=1 Tax=Bacteriovorax antarcticus TaxID=3088717 RepID=A0ABU5VUB2_9BACT|nr:hypothetical protein [Bacteriovorax sp. PP10]MEA9355610.1 hypothetical protein [Bacteriovorax sp. PP10]
MKKLFYAPVTFCLIASCSHKPINKEIDTFTNHSFDTTREPTSEKTCRDIIYSLLTVAGTPNISAYSAKTWNDLDKSIMLEFNKALTTPYKYTGYKIYKEGMPHVEVLKKVFNIRPGEKTENTVGTIIDQYTKYMDNLVSTNVVKREDVLLPAFVFKKPDGNLLWKSFGKEIPDDAVIERNIISPETLNAMAKEGYFPVGNDEHTINDISAFEHDLAHFTGFIDSPEYMKEVKKLALTDQSRLTVNQAKRASFFKEGMVYIKDDEALMKTLKISDEMRKNPSQVTLEEMKKYLNGFSIEELETTRMELASNINKYYVSLGGSGRHSIDPRSNIFHDIVQSVLPMISRGLPGDDGDYVQVASKDGLAVFQTMLLRLRDIKYSDWSYAVTHTPPKDSPIYKFFEESRRWQSKDDPMLDLYRDFVELRRTFLTDPIDDND